MGQFPRKYRTIFFKLNNIRNKFAHNRNAILEISKARELFSTLPKSVQKYTLDIKNNSVNSLDILQYAIASLYLSLEKTLEGIRRRKLYSKVTWELVEERIPDIWQPIAGSSKKRNQWIDDEIEKRVKKFLDDNPEVR